MKDSELLNRYSLVSLLVLLLLPFVYLLQQDLFATYIEAFDNLSIPIWAALYSGFWVRYHLKIKKLQVQITVLSDRAASYKKMANREYINEERKAGETFSNAVYELEETKNNFDFINIALRVSIIVAAGIKIIQLLYGLLWI